MKKNKKWLLLLALLLAVVIARFVFNYDPIERPQPIEVYPEPAKLRQTASEDVQTVFQAGPDIPNSYTQCQVYNKQYESFLRKWQIQMTLDAAKLLERGYSLDQVTYAIKHFRNGNFAVSWRHDYLLQSSKEARRNQDWMERIEEELGQKSQIRVSSSFPRISLKNYEQMTAMERRKAIEKDPPTVDDIYAFLKNEQLTELEIISLIDAVEHREELLYHGGPQHAVQLMDALLNSRMPEAANYLLDTGYTPMNDAYFNNSLEMALRTLDIEFNTTLGEKQKKTIKRLVRLIERLAERGLTAKLKVRNDGSIQFDNIYSGPYFEFSMEEQDQILEQFGFNIQSVASDELTLDQTKIDALISELTLQQERYLKTTFNELDYQGANRHCNDLVQQADATWKAPWGLDHQLISQLEQQYSGDTKAIEAELAIRDPDFVDCFQDQKADKLSWENERTRIGQAFYQKQAPRTREALEAFFQKHNPNNEERSWIAYQFFKSNYMDSSIPIELGIIPTKLDYRNLGWQGIKTDRLVYLNSVGFDTRTLDDYGYTALYFAAKAGRQELIQFMLDNDYLFSGGNNTPDPLHITLASWKKRFSSENVKSMLPLLMQFAPDIDRFHLARMKLIALRDKTLYQFIVDRYPQLTPNETIEYPQAACRN